MLDDHEHSDDEHDEVYGSDGDQRVDEAHQRGAADPLPNGSPFSVRLQEPAHLGTRVQIAIKALQALHLRKLTG